MPLPLTLPEMVAALADMTAAFPKFRTNPEDADRTAKVFHEVLRDFDREAIHGAGTLYRKTGEKFPTPKQWRDSATEWLRRNRTSVWATDHATTDRDGRDIVCRECRSVGRWALLTKIDGREVVRMIAPCDPSRAHRHPDSMTPKPPTFTQWLTDAEATDALGARLVTSLKGEPANGALNRLAHHLSRSNV